MSSLARLATQSGILPAPRYVLEALPARLGQVVTVYDTQNRDSEGNRFLVQAVILDHENPIPVLKKIRRTLDAGAARYGKPELLPFGYGLI